MGTMKMRLLLVIVILVAMVVAPQAAPQAVLLVVVLLQLEQVEVEVPPHHWPSAVLIS